MPRDMLPILTKDQVKQKAIEASAASGLIEAKVAADLRKTSAKQPSESQPVAEQPSTGLNFRRIPMKIQAIPAFRPALPMVKLPSPEVKSVSSEVKPPLLPIPETASQDIPSGSPTPSANSQLSNAPAKLNLGRCLPACKVLRNQADHADYLGDPCWKWF
jgi:hypothetical protein